MIKSNADHRWLTAPVAGIFLTDFGLPLLPPPVKTFDVPKRAAFTFFPDGRRFTQVLKQAKHLTASISKDDDRDRIEHKDDRRD
ncbi:hypothetical protein KCP76_12005 [Salmonella enterica subsp. enterica serovar Weltevreden]|nr:hypothetical protein KCP76_12005 [Salmonella enterica subsp. enterica serovar Weltevreden]